MCKSTEVCPVGGTEKTRGAEWREGDNECRDGQAIRALYLVQDLEALLEGDMAGAAFCF